MKVLFYSQRVIGDASHQRYYLQPSQACFRQDGTCAHALTISDVRACAPVYQDSIVSLAILVSEARAHFFTST